MKKLFLTLTIGLFIFGVSNAQVDTDVASHSVAVTIPDIAIIDIESTTGSNDITLAPDVSALDAGEEVDFTAIANSELWLNYTSILGTGVTSRRITVESSDISSLSGMELSVSAADPSGTGTTAAGVAGVADVVLTNAAQPVVNGIKSGYTGDGASNGCNLTYKLAVTDIAALEQGNPSVTVTYTIVDN